MAEGEGKFEGKSGAKEEDGLTDACLAELDALGSTSDAKLLAARSGKGASDGNEAVAVSIVFDDGENLIFAWQGATKSSQVVAECGQRDFAPSAKIAGGAHRNQSRGEGGGERVKKAVRELG